MNRSRTSAFGCAAALLFVLQSASTDDAAPKPQYGRWGFDSAGADLSTRPGDNFFRYANGTWLDRTTIPADKPGYSLRLAMTDAPRNGCTRSWQTQPRTRDTRRRIARQGRRLLQGLHGRGASNALGAAPIDPELIASARPRRARRLAG